MRWAAASQLILCVCVCLSGLSPPSSFILWTLGWQTATEYSTVQTLRHIHKNEGCHRAVRGAMAMVAGGLEGDDIRLFSFFLSLGAVQQ